VRDAMLRPKLLLLDEPSFGLVGRARDLPIALRCRGWRHLREPRARAYDRSDIGGLILVFLFFRFTPLGLAMRAAARNPVSSRLVGIRVGRMSALRLGDGRCNWSGGRNDGGADRLSRPQYDMMSGILEINDRTNDSSLVTFQAPLHQVFKGNPVERDMAHQSHYSRKQLREHELR
jgi:hypothetical protein